MAFAAIHGLTVDEAEVILARRQKLSQVLEAGEGRAVKARLALLAAHKKTGAAEVTLEGDTLVKGDVSMENLEKFYASKAAETRKVDDWEEPP